MWRVLLYDALRIHFLMIQLSVLIYGKATGIGACVAPLILTLSWASAGVVAAKNTATIKERSFFIAILPLVKCYLRLS